MNKRRSLICTVILVLGVIVGVAGAVWQHCERQTSAQNIAAAQQLAGISESAAVSDELVVTQPDDSSAIPTPTVDLAALREQNSDIVGWIMIPGTDISYPLLQAVDNEHYLHHAWNDEPDAAGAIFLECQNSAALTDFNTIIYGHNMRDGSMFGSLHEYREAGYCEEHPDVFIVNDGGVRRYRVFAAFEAGVTDITYGLGIASDADRQSFIDFSLKQSVIGSDIKPVTHDLVLTLSTCTGRGHAARWVVQAVLMADETKEE